jgi:DNA-binding XRE family transcriptional regulator
MTTRNKSRATTRSLAKDLACDPPRTDASEVRAKRAQNPERAREILRREMIIAGSTFVRRTRDAANMTQEQLATALDISQTRVAQLESSGKGKHTRPLELMTLARVAQACGRRLKLDLE